MKQSDKQVISLEITDKRYPHHRTLGGDERAQFVMTQVSGYTSCSGLDSDIFYPRPRNIFEYANYSDISIELRGSITVATSVKDFTRFSAEKQFNSVFWKVCF